MELREFAERILFSPDLEEKLLQPDDFTDDAPGEALAAPEFPAREKRLLPGPRPPNEPTLRRLRRLENDANRALLLHHFANHELLALEIMALTLLRFPDAPREFRMSVAHALKEEQVHFSLYRERMNSLGVDFGDASVNDFFWKFLRDMESPLDYVARMSLTFEQANLDYATYYLQAFRAIGDTSLESVLKRVLEDEIGHVRLGVLWLDRFQGRLPGESHWDAYRRLLPSSLDPARAMGLEFNAEARRRAGIPEDSIRKLRVYSRSRGRPPRVFLFHPACEADFSPPGPGEQALRFPSGLLRDIRLDLEPLLLFLTRREDILLMENKPSSDFLETMQTIGVNLPELLPWKGATEDLRAGPPPELRKRKLGGLEPWCWNPVTLEYLRPLLERVVGREGTRLKERAASGLLSSRTFHSKGWAAQVLRDFLREPENQEAAARSFLCPPSVVAAGARDEAAVRSAIEASLRQGRPALLKAPFGSAGQGRLIAREYSEDARRFSARLLETQGEVVVEPLLDRVLDFSAQLVVENSGTVRFLGMARALNNQGGAYRGALFGRMFDDLPPEAASFLRGGARAGEEGAGIKNRLSGMARFAGKSLFEAGFRGAAGIDAFVYRTAAGEPRLKPLSEINARCTMGRIVLEIAKHARSHRANLFLILPLEDVRRAGYEGFPDFKEKFAKRFPVKTYASARPLLDGGVFFLQDFRIARRTLPLLFAGENLDECLEAFRDFPKIQGLFQNAADKKS